MKNDLLRMLREFSIRTGILEKSLFSVYQYMHQPHQLEYLLRCVRETKEVPRRLRVEVGCAFGATTALLKKHLDGLGCAKRYIAIDTFSGFVLSDVDYEVRVRGKTPAPYSAFRKNRLEWVERSLQLANAQGVELVQARLFTV